MKQLYIVNPKGGSGKTTLATQIASYYARENSRVALVDHDKQQSSIDWLKIRPKSLVPITQVCAFRGEVLSEPCDLAIHDMPAGCDIEDLGLVDNCVAKVLIPILPSPTDIKAGVRFLMALNRQDVMKNAGVSIGLVANRVRVNTTYYNVLVSFLSQVNMQLIASIRDTQNYIRAMDNGISIFDFPPSKVANDIEQWKPLFTWIDS